MSHPEHRIPDDVAAEVLAEAARLNAAMHQGYTFQELEQAGLEAQIPPEIIAQALKIVEERRQARQLNWPQAKARLKQQLTNLTSSELLIPVALTIATIILLPVSYRFVRLPDLQNQIQELKNENLKIQTQLDATNQQLDLKDQEIAQLQQSKNTALEEVRALKEKDRIEKSREVDPKTGLMYRDSFTKAVIKQSKYQVIQAVGRPNRTKDLGQYSHWHYDKKTIDRITRKVDSSISIVFVNGTAEDVNSSN
jgi:hypothetical protein